MFQLLKSTDAVTNFLADLREHLNDFAPIHRLPPELLSLIFSTHLPRRHKNIFDFDRNFIDSYPYTRRWNALFAQICRRWRAVALDTPEPWAYISVPPHSKQFHIHVERSRAHGLFLSIGTHNSDLEKVLRSVGPRLCRLDIAITTRPVAAIKPSTILQIDAPRLRCATFMCAREKFSRDTGGRGSPEVEWVELFGQRNCSLRALALALATNWLPSNTFTELTHLLLSCNPHLSGTSSAAHVDRSGTRQVALDHLRSLVVDRCTRAFLLPFIARLIIPAHTPITLVEITVGGDASPAPLLDESSPVTRLEIYTEGPNLQIIAKSALHDFLLQWRSEVGEWFERAPHLHRLFTASAVTSLKVSLGWHPVYFHDTSFGTLSGMNSLTTLCIFIRDLGRNMNCRTSNFPALSLLTIYLQWPNPDYMEEDPILYSVSDMLHTVRMFLYPNSSCIRMIAACSRLGRSNASDSGSLD
ncbi:hypothetical protein L227DRAFT_656311 [Lentinus tigrinus ALCF2SS1-6]|uniref:Uncharacterized protein n=1 Tax=Lentinus tigrinus ALCF2SS1-6 TaxID=1328759 RepID=A0A5C2RYS1_9APHY|nr:hypothetical protein L227DRAFT_656311 [Lentinus tigrinus ALCF2SS1-6]